MKIEINNYMSIKEIKKMKDKGWHLVDKFIDVDNWIFRYTFKKININF